jgi:quercetin dioxygenase-like cupin family protein
MKVIRFADARRCEPDPGWRRAALCDGKDISIEHFVKPPRHLSPRHSHPQAQVLVVLEGEIAVITDGEGRVVLGKGDTAYVAGDEPHVVENVLDVESVALDIFVPGRSFDFWQERARRMK